MSNNKKLNKKNKEFRVFTKNQPFFNFIKKILRIFYVKPEVIYLDTEIKGKSILLANHCAKKGPLVYELFLPFHACWGAHEMFGNYSSRFHYLRDVYYMQKKGKGKFSSTLISLFEAIFSPLVYKGMKCMPTFTDSRMVNTILNSKKVLDADIPVLIFPENSNEGYKDVLTEFYSGFVILADQYFKRTGVDLPVYPVYYYAKSKKLFVGKPQFIQELFNKGLDRNALAEHFKNEVNNLYLNYLNSLS